MPIDSYVPTSAQAVQRQLRDQLLSGSAVRRRECRDLAAHLLLYLEDFDSMIGTCLEWLCETLRADRADGGLLRRGSRVYEPTRENIQAFHAEMPSIIGVRFEVDDPAVAPVLNAHAPIVYCDVERDPRPSPVRRILLDAGVRHKLTVALRSGDIPVGLLCLDRGAGGHAWDDRARELLDDVSASVLHPIVSAVAPGGRLAFGRVPTALRPPAPKLTPAERRVAQLVLQGCSYKEIARVLGRSSSTVDHQLRSLREKLGVHSTPKLLGVLMTMRHELELPADAA